MIAYTTNATDPSGATWNNFTPSSTVNGCGVVSGDGSTFYACGYSQKIYKSSTTAVNFTASYNANTNSSYICTSYDGRYVAACVNNGGIRASADYGSTWNDIATSLGSKYWVSICMSEDGSKIYASENNTGLGNIYYTNNFGVNWYNITNGVSAPLYNLAGTLTNSSYVFDPSNSTISNLQIISTSKDGRKVLCCGNGGYIYSGILTN